MLISNRYRDLNIELHSRGNYGISGAKWATVVDGLARRCNAATVLDYGCGQGTLKTALSSGYPYVDPPYVMIEYDPAVEGKTDRPANADLVVCGDVLEHVEPDCLNAVLDDIRNIGVKAVFLVVAMQPAVKVLSDGRNAHLLVKPAEWWFPRLTERWRVQQFQDKGGEFVCVGTPR